MQQLNLEEIIDEVQYLIKSSDGDTGRLSHILQAINNGQDLFESDKIFLENKLGVAFSLEEETKPAERKILSDVQRLIDSGVGDTMRLKHIYDTISNNKTFYKSDQNYLEKKINENLGKSFEKGSLYDQKPEETNISEPADLIEEKKIQPRISEQGAMPKGWTPPKINPSAELENLQQEIKIEEEKIESENDIKEKISLHRQKLEELIQKRHEYEKQVSVEQNSLKSKIQEEQEKITTQSNLAQQIFAHFQGLIFPLRFFLLFCLFPFQHFLSLFYEQKFVGPNLIGL